MAVLQIMTANNSLVPTHEAGRHSSSVRWLKGIIWGVSRVL